MSRLRNRLAATSEDMKLAQDVEDFLTKLEELVAEGRSFAAGLDDTLGPVGERFRLYVVNVIEALADNRAGNFDFSKVIEELRNLEDE